MIWESIGSFLRGDLKKELSDGDEEVIIFWFLKFMKRNWSEEEDENIVF